MRFILFPEAANSNSGCNIVVSSDYNRLKIKPEDKVLWHLRTTSMKSNFAWRSTDSVIYHPCRFAIKRVVNVLLKRMSIELFKKDIKPFISELEIAEEIFCDDYVFYRSIRYYFPKKHLYVRFHNLHYRNAIRAEVYKTRLDWKYLQVLKACSGVEKEIFNDNNVTPIFISAEDQQFYELTTKRSNSLLWDLQLEESVILNYRKNHHLAPVEKIVFYGGLTSHKKASVEYFMNSIWTKLRKKHPELEFHLYGKGTESFNDPKSKMFGHGFYLGDDYPHKSNSLYISPDLIGGGVKVKVAGFLEHGIPFITNTFGFEGFDSKLIDNKYCITKDFSEWIDEINNQIKNRGIDFH